MAFWMGFRVWSVGICYRLVCLAFWSRAWLCYMHSFIASRCHCNWNGVWNFIAAQFIFWARHCAIFLTVIVVLFTVCRIKKCQHKIVGRQSCNFYDKTIKVFKSRNDNKIFESHSGTFLIVLLKCTSKKSMQKSCESEHHFSDYTIKMYKYKVEAKFLWYIAALFLFYC